MLLLFYLSSINAQSLKDHTVQQLQLDVSKAERTFLIKIKICILRNILSKQKSFCSYIMLENVTSSSHPFSFSDFNMQTKFTLRKQAIHKPRYCIISAYLLHSIHLSWIMYCTKHHFKPSLFSHPRVTTVKSPTKTTLNISIKFLASSTYSEKELIYYLPHYIPALHDMNTSPAAEWK